MDDLMPECDMKWMLLKMNSGILDKTEGLRSDVDTSHNINWLYPGIIIIIIIIIIMSRC